MPLAKLRAMGPITPAMHDIYTMPGHLIRRAQQISTALFTEECAAFDLTSVQFAALMAIRTSPGVDATCMSQFIAFDRSTIGGVLDRLESKGWIRRGPSPGDRRIKLIELTEGGADLLTRVGPAVQRVQQRILGPLAPEDRATMLRLLAQLAEVHNEVTSAPLQILGLP